MDYSTFYDIAEYGNENWKGSFTPKEVACNAYDYFAEYKSSMNQSVPTHTIEELCKLLAEDGSKECIDWLYMILYGIGMIDVGYMDFVKYFPDNIKGMWN